MSIDRISVTHPGFAERLHGLLTPHLPSFPWPVSQRKAIVNDDVTRLPKAMNSNIRMYRYDTGQYFGPHYDDSIRDVGSGLRSEWTLCGTHLLAS
jgi:alpha-1,3-mannosyltransferase